LNQLAFY